MLSLCNLGIPWTKRAQFGEWPLLKKVDHSPNYQIPLMKFPNLQDTLYQERRKTRYALKYERDEWSG